MSTTFNRLVEEYAAGTRCNLCRQPVTRRGCKCSLQGLYTDRAQEVMAWALSLPEDVLKPKKGIKILPAVQSALATERAKAGLYDEPASPDDPRGMSAATDDRIGQCEQLGVDPRKTKWTKSTMGPERRPAKRSAGVNPATAGGFGGRATGLSTTVR